jgi:hypothetical protein
VNDLERLFYPGASTNEIVGLLPFLLVRSAGPKTAHNDYLFSSLHPVRVTTMSTTAKTFQVIVSFLLPSQ